MYRLILFRITESYFQRRWLYLLPIFILLAAGIVFVVLSKPKYVAQGILYVQRDTFLSQLTQVRTDSGSWWTTSAQITANEIKDLIQTDAFVRAVIKETDLEEEMNQGPSEVSKLIQEVRENIWALPQGDNQIIVGAVNEEPALSIQLVGGVIDSYLRWKTNAERTESEVALSFFSQLIQNYRNDMDIAIDNLRAYLEENPEPIRGDRPAMEVLELERLQREINLAETRLSSAMNKEEDARLSIKQLESDIRQAYIVIDAPHIPDSKVTSRRDQAVTIAIFGAVGVALTGILIFGSAFLDSSFRLPQDVQQRLGLPVLAVITDTKQVGKRARKAKKAIAKKQPAEGNIATQKEPTEEEAILTDAAA
jgi:capsular polysaccharide biosynthesis protein